MRKEITHRGLAGVLQGNGAILQDVFSQVIVFKMKALIVLLCFFLSQNAFTQPWHTALKSARESYLLKSYQQAVSQYQTAQKLAPKNIDISLELAQALYKAEKYEDAEKLYQNQLNKKHSHVSTADIHRQVGNSRMHQDKYKEAIDSYKNALRSNPDDQLARHNLAKAIEKREEQEKPKPKPKPQDSSSPKNSNPNSDPQEAQENKSKQKQEVNNQSSNSPKAKKEQSLSDIRTERLLEELTEKEKETKRSMNSKIGDKSSSMLRTKKDW